MNMLFPIAIAYRTRTNEQSWRREIAFVIMFLCNGIWKETADFCMEPHILVKLLMPTSPRYFTWILFLLAEIGAFQHS
jgi:hypothetical protein